MNSAELIRGPRAYGLLLLLCAALYLPGIAALPVTDRDEARFAQATRQMVATGDLVRIRFQDEARNKKPAGIYWLQAASVAIFSDAPSTAIWPYRLPSLVGATLAVVLTFYFGALWFGREAGFLGAALLAASLGLTVEAHLAKTDAALLATVVAAQGALGEIYRRSRIKETSGSRLALLFWIAQGIGILIKGPITPLIGALTMGALAWGVRDWRWLGRLKFQWGVPLAILIAGPWLAAIVFATDGAFVSEAVGGDMLAKLIHGQESHGAPPGAYAVLVFATFWPGALALGVAARHGWRERREPMIGFLLAWLVPFWLVMEAIPTKLPHYVLPAYPALALLAGVALLAAKAAAGRRHWLDLLAIVLWAVVALVLTAAFVIAPVLLGGPPRIGGIGAVLGLGLVTLTLISMRRGGTGALAAVLAAVAFWSNAFGLVLPRLDAIWLSRAAAELVAAHGPQAAPIVAVGYSEPSLVFLLGTETKIASPAAAAALMAAEPGTRALVRESSDMDFKTALSGAGLTATKLGDVVALDITHGRGIGLILYAAQPK